jgi:hypothetical protein
MKTAHAIIELAIDPFVLDGAAKAKDIIDALDLGGYAITSKREWPHHVNTSLTEVHRDGEMRAM